jgi:predicted short-subunit dehydrogenase-like oxidoreductase (DUF2520 family)
MDLTEYKHKLITATASGDNTLVRAVPGKRIIVTAIYVVSTSALTVQFTSETSGTELTGAMALAANGSVQAAFHPDGHFATLPGELLNMALSAGTAVNGWLTYRVSQ